METVVCFLFIQLIFNGVRWNQGCGKRVGKVDALSERAMACFRGLNDLPTNLCFRNQAVKNQATKKTTNQNKATKL
jgi:hypothetical protein